MAGKANIESIWNDDMPWGDDSDSRQEQDKLDPQGNLSVQFSIEEVSSDFQGVQYMKDTATELGAEPVRVDWS